MIKFNRPWQYAYPEPCYLIYKNDQLSHIISLNTKKASIVFTYGANAKCTKIYHKYAVDDKIPNEAPSFGDISDGQYGAYDSLVYSPTNQLQQIYYIQKSGNDITTAELIKLYYSTSSDTSLNRLERYVYDSNNNLILDDQLVVNSNTIDNPVNKLLWFFPFVTKLSINSGGDPLELPILFDDPSSNLLSYTPLIPKSIAKYSVNNSWGLYNYTSSFDYGYSRDSSTLSVVKEGDVFGLVVHYEYVKAKKN